MHRLHRLVRPLCAFLTLELVFMAAFLISLKLACGRIAENWDAVRGIDSFLREFAITEAMCIADHVLQMKFLWLQVLGSLCVGGLAAVGVFRVMKLKKWPAEPQSRPPGWSGRGPLREAASHARSPLRERLEQRSMTGMSGVLEVGLGAQGKEEVEKLMAAVALGLAEAVMEGKMTASDACGYFFVPGYLRLEQSPGVDPRLMDALHAGSELEDVARLAPRGLKGALQEIRANALAVLEGLGESRTPLKNKWLR